MGVDTAAKRGEMRWGRQRNLGKTTLSAGVRGNDGGREWWWAARGSEHVCQVSNWKTHLTLRTWFWFLKVQWPQLMCCAHETLCSCVWHTCVCVCVYLELRWERTVFVIISIYPSGWPLALSSAHSVFSCVCLCVCVCVTACVCQGVVCPHQD